MTAREIQIAKKILDALHALDGGQEHQLAIHAAIGGLNVCPTAEFESVWKLLDTKKWILGVQTEFRGVMWEITDAGAGKRLKLS